MKSNNSKGSNKKLLGIVFLIFALIFISISIVTGVNYYSNNNIVKDYRSGIDELEKTIDEINITKNEFVEIVDDISTECSSLTYNTVNDASLKLDELEDIGDKLIEQVNKAENLSHYDYSTEFDLDLISVVNNFEEWINWKIEFIEEYNKETEENSKIIDPIEKTQAESSQELDVISMRTEELAFTVTGDDLVSGLNDIDFVSDLYYRIGLKTEIAYHYLMATIIFGFFAILSLILSFIFLRRDK